MSYATDKADPDRRRLILRIMAENQGSASESTIEQTMISLGESLGVDRDYVRAQLDFLKTATCISVELYRDRIMVATLTPAGVAVLEGRKTTDGVARRKLGESITLAD